MNGITSTLRITATERDGARVFVRRHEFSVGGPIEFDVDSPRVAALEYAFGAVGAEIVGGLQAFAKRRRVELDAVEAVVKGELENPLTYLEVIGETGRPRITRVHVKVYISSSADERAVRQLWDETQDHLPLVCTLGGALRLDIELALTA